MQGFEFVGATHIPDASGEYSAALIPSPPLAWDGFLNSTPDWERCRDSGLACVRLTLGLARPASRGTVPRNMVAPSAMLIFGSANLSPSPKTLNGLAKRRPEEPRSAESGASLLVRATNRIF